MPRGTPMVRSAVDKSRTHAVLAHLLIFAGLLPLLSAALTSTALTSAVLASAVQTSTVLASAVLASTVLALPALASATLTSVALASAALNRRRRSSEVATKFDPTSSLFELPLVFISNDSQNLSS